MSSKPTSQRGGPHAEATTASHSSAHCREPNSKRRAPMQRGMGELRVSTGTSMPTRPHPGPPTRHPRPCSRGASKAGGPSSRPFGTAPRSQWHQSQSSRGRPTRATYKRCLHGAATRPVGRRTARRPRAPAHGCAAMVSAPSAPIRRRFGYGVQAAWPGSANSWASRRAADKDRPARRRLASRGIGTCAPPSAPTAPSASCRPPAAASPAAAGRPVRRGTRR
mmetsp:Transcript_65420/g.188199  ORF Transcript_65420/g.188199 Transcript_65420/m.188199 type:complete len:222 (+) Transcript_65420:1220-1885(+)